MRIFSFILSTLITLALVYVLDRKWDAVPPLGKFLSPQQGFWQNAEPTGTHANEHLVFKDLKGKVNVYMDDRLVPHVFAEQEEDAYFVQGYLHAKHRLWQMEFQTFAAAGRVSEFLGSDPRFIRFDREQRRLGMVYGAEKAVQAMEADPFTKSCVDAYTAGVNSYIRSLTAGSLPIEYKLLDYRPELWSNFKIGLFLKQMSKNLAGGANDLEYTNAKAVFSASDLSLLYPDLSDSSVSIVPSGATFRQPLAEPQAPPTADSLYFGNDTSVQAVEISRPNRLNGSNNWAVSGQKTASGAPILCNDPHLGLTFPAIWYEMQLTTPQMNVYGATFPGSPSVIIGFNDSIAFGFTNAQRDVKDYYQVRFRDDSKKEYWFENSWQPTTLRIEQVRVRDAATLLDTVAYTYFGPVLFDGGFASEATDRTGLAVRWIAHEPSNESWMWLKLNRAASYADYEEAIRGYVAPGQNMLFASREDIALRQQALFPARWYGQGLYIMPGEDSSYRWQGMIPQEENPHILNPIGEFIQSANQRPVDAAYPYFIPGDYIVSRGITLSRRLTDMQKVTPQDMMRLQNDVYDPFAAAAVPLLLQNVDSNRLNDTERRYLGLVSTWDFQATAESKAPTVFNSWWKHLAGRIWTDEFARVKGKSVLPENQTLLEALLRDSSFHFIDNITTSETETLAQQVTAALQEAGAELQQSETTTELTWWKQKNTSVYHLLRTLLPFARTGLQVGGWSTTVNAVTDDHGPSWRMVVHLTNPVEAYAVYPGGQSGNPGSPFYDSFLDTWTAGKYYNLWLMKETEKGDPRIRCTLTFSNT